MTTEANEPDKRSASSHSIRSSFDNPSAMRTSTSPAAGRGTGDHIFDIVPGHPEDSILPFRMGSREPGVMMPEQGRGTVHLEGLALIRDWIAAMPGQCGV